MSGALGGGGAWKSLKRVSDPIRALESPGLFNPRGSLWFLLLNQLVGASEARLFCVILPLLQTEVILLNKLANPLGVEILKL